MLLFGTSWAALGEVLAASGAVLGSLGGVLGPPWPLLGPILASRCLLLELFWASSFGAPAKSRNPQKVQTVQRFLRFFEASGGPKSFQNRSRRPLEASLAASWAALSGLRWLLGTSWAFLSGLGCKQASELSATQRKPAQRSRNLTPVTLQNYRQ